MPKSRPPGTADLVDCFLQQEKEALQNGRLFAQVDEVVFPDAVRQFRREVGDDDRDEIDINLAADEIACLRVECQINGRTAHLGNAGREPQLVYPPLRQQFAHQTGDSGFVQSGDSGEIGAGKRRAT